MIKTCSTCKKEKNIDQFTKDTSKMDGLKINCSDCCKEYSKNYYKNNREKEKIRGMEYDSTHRHVRRKWKNDYYSKNRLKIISKNKEYRQKNKKYLNEKRKKNIVKYLNERVGGNIR